MIFEHQTAAKPFVDLYLGSAHTVQLYWESVGEKIGLPSMIAITERADSEAGFCLSGHALTAFSKELAKLSKYWAQTNQPHARSPHHSKVMSELIAALSDESFNNAILMIC